MLKDRFELLHTLQRGPLSRTWLGRDHQTQQEVVLKEVSLHDLSPSEGFKPFELMEREGRALRHLDHPGIPKLVEIFEISEPETTLWLVMEKKEGRNLEALVESGYRGSLPEIIGILRATAEILQYLHDRVPPLVHRDVKPKNILLDDHGKVSLVDFGAVATSALTHATSGSTIVGSPGYVPLEQFAGRARPASDVYALGMVGVFLMTHTEPVKLTDASGRTKWRDQLELQSPLFDVIDRMIEPNLDRRMGSMAEVISGLDGKTKAPRKRRRAVAVGVAAAVAITGATYGVAHRPQPFVEFYSQLAPNQLGGFGALSSVDESGPDENSAPPPEPLCLPRVTAGTARVFCSEVPQLTAPAISKGQVVFFTDPSALPPELAPTPSEPSSAEPNAEDPPEELAEAIRVTPTGLQSLGRIPCPAYGASLSASGKNGKIYLVCSADSRKVIAFDPKTRTSEEIASYQTSSEEYDVGYGYEGSFEATPPFLVVPDGGRSVIEVFRGQDGLRAQQFRTGAMPFEVSPPKSSEIETDPLFFYEAGGRLHALYGKFTGGPEGNSSSPAVQYVPVVFSTHGKKELSPLATTSKKPKLDSCIPLRTYSDGADLLARIPDEFGSSYDELRIPNARPVPSPTAFPVGLESCHTDRQLEIHHPIKGRFQVETDENHSFSDPVTTCDEEGCVIVDSASLLVLRLDFD